MNKGTVKFFNESKGFGFITEEGNNKEHFVHVSVQKKNGGQLNPQECSKTDYSLKPQLT
jgi:cold shock CspA family protein